MRVLSNYAPPRFLRIAPAQDPHPKWWLRWSAGPDFGADALPELLDALLHSCSSLPSLPNLARVEGEKLTPVEEIPQFSGTSLLPRGLSLQRVWEAPAMWLLLLNLGRTEGGVWVPEVERYLGGWWASLFALRRACRG